MTAHVWLVVIEGSDIPEHEVYAKKADAERRAKEVEREAKDAEDFDTSASVHYMEVRR